MDDSLLARIWEYAKGEVEDVLASERQSNVHIPINIDPILEMAIQHNEDYTPEQILAYELPRRGAREFIENLTWLERLLEKFGSLQTPEQRKSLIYATKCAKSYLSNQ